MILDFHANPDAGQYVILDSFTGLELVEPIVYADDERGFYRRLIPAAKGGYQHRDGEVLTEDVHAGIRIRRRFGPDESWRDRPAML